MTSSENACALRIQTQQDDSRRLAEVIAHKAAESPPLLAWAEPDPLYVDRLNRTGRRGDFVPLVLGAPDWPADLPLVEARLFWPRAALHVVAREDGGCVWTRIEETDPEGKETDYRRNEFSVYTLRDRHRFGLSDDIVIDDLMAIEYRQRGRLVAWRLMIGVEA
jgi:hypothetical protein